MPNGPMSSIFAVGDEFPVEILPDDTRCGVIITDGFDCYILREAPVKKLAGARRNHLIKRLARTAMLRSTRDDDGQNKKALTDARALN